MHNNKDSIVYDVIVIGGGPAGAHAAYPIVEAGRSVLMLDAGVLAAPDTESHSGDFESVRANDSKQHELFFGKELTGIVQGGTKSHAASMVSGVRAHVSAHTDTHALTREEGIGIIRSFAKGGLSEAWGAVCTIFTDEELKSVGIPSGEMSQHYRAVIERIGVSGIGGEYLTQPPARIDSHARGLLERYAQLPAEARERFILAQPLLAMLTQPLHERPAISYRDLEYVLNEGAIYRARFTIEALEQKENFTYVPQRIVERVVLEGSNKCVIAKDFEGNTHEYSARTVIVAAGALHTAGILLRSFASPGVTVPFFVKRNVITPCIDLKTIGKKDEREKHSLCQLTIDTPHSYSHLYSYKSLLLSRLVRYLPLPAPEALALFALWAPAFVFVDTRIPSTIPDADVHIAEDGALVIKARAHSSEILKTELKKLKRFLRRLGLLPIRSVEMPLGASVHYAGGIPFEDGSNRPLSVNSKGELTQARGIYVADSATWRMLPDKPPALTIMANADRIGTEVLKAL